MKKKLALPLAVVTAFAAVGCSSNTDTADSPKKDAAQEVKIAFRSEPEVLDQSKATSEESFTMVNAFGEGLYRLDKDNKPQPAMAAALPEISEDGKVYTIKLRDNANWSDGSPVTAEDFVYSWKRTLAPETGSQYAFMINNWVKGAEEYNTKKAPNADGVGVTALDNKTLKIELKAPVAFFTSQLSFPVFFPLKKDVVEKHGDKYAADADKVVANGPYTLSKWDHEQELEFVKNDKYWDAANVKLEKITFQISKDQNSSLNLYETEDADIVEINRDQVVTWKDKPDYIAVPTLFSYGLRFNQKTVPAFKNANIRRALTMAIDRQGLVDTVLGNGSKAATGEIPFGTLDGNNAEFRKTAGDTILKFDPVKAKELLQKGLDELGMKELPKFKMIGDDDEVGKKTMEYIQAQYKQYLGIEPDVQNLPKKLRVQQQNDGQFEMLAPSRWGADYNDPMTFLDLWESDGMFNYISYNSPEYDKLVKGAKVEADPQKRTQMLVDAEKILMNDAAIGPLYFLGRSYLKRPSIDGLVFPATGAQYEFRWASIK
ncbi:peptide ABC transporter substrate-binding protein [Tumebacillus sp. DT12]|uniref:Peptide ABC transporter substrate-binding protein n=1 Tax=Tumebacillus lacus TaxID=2995335 RepID=A0ABT3X631_9BACL|nr:peptide ABC transporter substrate-binding protein [Tumebacillus lacus]MCX7571886.1 peptide ABC transporter substrate-binding protein [Tumebacillus lacus]